MFLRALDTFWNNLQPREQKLLSVVAALSILGLLSFYLTNSFKKVNVQQNILTREKENFQYVYDKAKNYYKFVELQNAISSASKESDYLMLLNQKFNFTEFNISEEEDEAILYFSTSSIKNAVDLISDASAHPAISISTITITPSSDNFVFRVRL